MYKSKLAIFFDSITISIISLFITFGWLNKIVKNAKISLFVANIVSLLLFFVIFYNFYKKYNCNKFNHKQNKFLSECIFYLSFQSTKHQNLFFEKLLNAKFLSNNIFESDKFIIYINIQKPLSANDFYKANDFYLSSNKEKNLVFLSLSSTEEFNKILNSAPNKYSAFYKEDLFTLMETQKIYPIEKPAENKFSNKFSKQNIKNKCSTLFSRNKFKNMFFSGLSLTILSFFIRYNFLYLFSGSLLLIFSCVCFFQNKQVSPSKLNITEILNKK